MKLLTKFWETEEIIVKLTKNKENEISEEDFAHKQWRDEESKYVVSMSFKRLFFLFRRI